MNIFPILVLFFFLRLILANLFPLTADESYYWLWAKHLDWSYVDHPPMIAYLNFLTTLGRENLLGLRLGAIFLTTLTALFIYLLSKRILGEKVAFWSTILFQILPHFLVIWLTMFVELPLGLFWIISLFLLEEAIFKQKTNLWYLLGITVGLGCLSKYTMFLFWPCLTLFLVLAPRFRFWIKRKEPYVAFLISIFLFLPVIYWNSQHDWISFFFHTGKATADPWGVNFLPFLVDQIVHFSPFLIFLLYPTLRYALREDEKNKFLFSFSFPVLFLFTLLSIKIKVWAHWPAIGYLTLLPLVISNLSRKEKSLRRYLISSFTFSLLVLAILFWVTPGILRHQKNYIRNYQLAALIPKNYKIFAKTNVSAALLEFYLKRPVYLATGFLKPHPLWGEKQYELWGIPELKKKESIYYFGEDSNHFRKEALRCFEKISETPIFNLYLIEDYINNSYKLFFLEHYKKTSEHP